MAIVAPDDLLPESYATWHDDRCLHESPAWGYEGEGEQCRRPKGHDGPHYTTGFDYSDGGSVLSAIQWEPLP